VRNTVLSVALSVQIAKPEEAGQFVPSSRHTFCPETRREEPEAFVKAKVVAVAWVAVRRPVERRVMFPKSAKRFVVVTEVPVDWVKVTPMKEETPVAERFEAEIPPKA
jgi:hypothetical protein